MYYFKFVLLLLLIVFCNGAATADEHETDLFRKKDPTWAEFEKSMLEQRDQDRDQGLAYIISGGLVFIGSQIGYNNASRPVEKFSYSLAQSLGIAGIGYGASLRIGEDADSEFFESVQRTNGLSEETKTDLVRSFFKVRSDSRKKDKWIKVATYGLIAATSLFHAIQEPDDAVKTGLYVIGGINALISVSYAF